MDENAHDLQLMQPMMKFKNKEYNYLSSTLNCDKKIKLICTNFCTKNNQLSK